MKLFGGGGLGWRNKGWGVDETMKGQIVNYTLLKCYLK